MIDDISDIRDLYNRDPEKEHERLVRHQLEHDLTWRYFDRYLPPSGTILEIGAATGKYTLEFARRGYTITATDVSEASLAQCQRQLVEAGYEKDVTCLVGDARDLSQIADNTFDVVLLMGPLYHLVIEADRILALQQAFRKLKPGGIVCSSFISRFGIWGGILKRVPHWIEKPAELRSIIQHGREPEDSPKEGFRGYFATVPEIAPLHEQIGFNTTVLTAVEPAISADDESYNILEGEGRQAWLDFFFEISTNPTIIGASRHLLYIGQKPLF